MLRAAGAQDAYERAVRFPRGLQRQVRSSDRPRGFRRHMSARESEAGEAAKVAVAKVAVAKTNADVRNGENEASDEPPAKKARM